MAAMLPMSVYGLRVPAGGLPVPASDYDGTIRITMAAIDPSAEPVSEEPTTKPRATLKIVRLPMMGDDDDDESDDEDYDEADFDAIKARLPADLLGSEDDSDMSVDEDDSENEKNGGPSDPVKARKAKREAVAKKLKEAIAAEEMEIDTLVNGVNGVKAKGKGKADDDDDISSDDEDDESTSEEAEEFVLCTLDPENHYQQPLDITLGEHEQVYFVVSGTHDVWVTGNFVLPPDEAFGEDSDYDEEGEDEEMPYDLSPDEEELDDELSEDEEDALDGLPNPRITEVDSDDNEAPKLVAAGKKGKKRPAESSGDEDDNEAATLDELISKTMKPETNGEQKLSKKQAKKLKKNDGQAVAAAQESSKKDTPNSDKKKVQFAKNLEQGPTGSPKVDAKKETTASKTETAPAKSGPRNVGGVTVEDKKVGKGQPAKKGSKVEMRYIGKLKNGKQFDSNKKGKPFSFKLGVGEVIKGWDVGVAGMAAGGERRLTIPAKLAYGNKALPDIPANSELIFDIKCLSVN